MGLVANALERRSTLAAPADWLRDSLLGPRGTSGRAVGAEQALGLSAVYACVSLISETIASLPWPLYRRVSGGDKRLAPEHPIYALLHDRPNPEMTSYNFRNVMAGCVELWGNAYAEIEVDKGNRPIALWPLRPDRMAVSRVGGQQRRLSYQYTVPTGRSLFLPSERVLHWCGMSPDGFVGYSRLSLAREAFGLHMNLDDYATRYFANDSRPGGVLEHPGRLSPDAAERLRARWEATHKGPGNAGRVAVLEEGVSWKTIGIPPQDAQFLESRQFQRGEIASLFRIPPHMIGDVEKNTSWGTGIESMSIGFVTYSLRPRLVNIEQATSRALLTAAEQERYFCEFNVDGLLRGDSAARSAHLQTMRQNGVINAARWARLENLDPPPGEIGEAYLVQANMVTVDHLLNPPEPPPPPPPQAQITEEPAVDADAKTLPPPSAPAPTTGRAERTYGCKACGHPLFSSPDERGRITTRCPERTCREWQTVLVGGTAS